MNRFNSVRDFRGFRDDRFAAGSGPVLPANFVDVITGNPSIATPEAVDWTRPDETTATQTSLPYTTEGRYKFDFVGGDFDWGSGFNWSSNANIERIRINELQTASFNLEAHDCANCTQIEMDGFTHTTSGRIDAFNNSSATRFSAAALTYLTSGVGLALYNSAYTEINIPSFEEVIGLGGVDVSDCTSLESFSAPAMHTVKFIRADGCTAATSFSAPELLTVNVAGAAFELQNSGWTSIDVQKLTNIITGNLRAHSCSALASMNIDALVQVNGVIELYNCAFPEAQVDYLLGIFATNNAGSPITSVSKNIRLDGGTNAAPSATGEGHIDTLRADGWTVTVTGGY